MSAIERAAEVLRLVAPWGVDTMKVTEFAAQAARALADAGLLVADEADAGAEPDAGAVREFIDGVVKKMAFEQAVLDAADYVVAQSVDSYGNLAADVTHDIGLEDLITAVRARRGIQS